MATCTLADTVFSTANGPISSNSFTPVTGDLLIAVAFGAGTSDTTMTCTNSFSAGTWIQVIYATFTTAGNNGRMTVWIQDGLVTSGAGTVVTVTYPGDNTTGNHLHCYRVAGMTLHGSAALRQSAFDQSHAAGTPMAATFASAALTTNPIIVGVHDEGTATGWTPPSGWTESTSPAGEGISTVPTERTETAYRDSGFTGTTITWGNASTGVYASFAIELDASGAAAASLAIPPKQRRMMALIGR